MKFKDPNPDYDPNFIFLEKMILERCWWKNCIMEIFVAPLKSTDS